MNKLLLAAVLFVFLAIGLVAAFTTAPDRATDKLPERPEARKDAFPREAAEARKALAAWMKRFISKKQDEIEKELGKATDKGNFAGQLVLAYKTEDQNLEFYFQGDSVLMVSLQIHAVEVKKEALPREAAEARKTVAAWMKGLTSKKQDAVQAELGKATERDSIQNQLILRYKTADKGTLELFFQGDKVIAVSLQLHALFE